MERPATKYSIENWPITERLPSNARLKVLPPGSMCQATARVSRLNEIDADLMNGLRRAFDATSQTANQKCNLILACLTCHIWIKKAAQPQRNMRGQLFNW